MRMETHNFRSGKRQTPSHASTGRSKVLCPIKINSHCSNHTCIWKQTLWKPAKFTFSRTKNGPQPITLIGGGEPFFRKWRLNHTPSLCPPQPPRTKGIFKLIRGTRPPCAPATSPGFWLASRPSRAPGSLSRPALSFADWPSALPAEDGSWWVGMSILSCWRSWMDSGAERGHWQWWRLRALSWVGLWPGRWKAGEEGPGACASAWLGGEPARVRGRSYLECRRAVAWEGSAPRGGGGGALSEREPRGFGGRGIPSRWCLESERGALSCWPPKLEVREEGTAGWSFGAAGISGVVGCGLRPSPLVEIAAHLQM